MNFLSLLRETDKGPLHLTKLTPLSGLGRVNDCMWASGWEAQRHSPQSRGKQKLKCKGPLASRTGEPDYPDPGYGSYLSFLH